MLWKINMVDMDDPRGRVVEQGQLVCMYASRTCSVGVMAIQSFTKF